MTDATERPEPNSSAIDPRSIKIGAASNRASEDTSRNDSAERNNSTAYTIASTEPSDMESPPDQGHTGKKRRHLNPLILQLECAVNAGHIDEPFTAPDVDQWMTQCDIRQGDGKKYKEGYAANLLSNSLIKNKKTKNRNSKWLLRRRNENGICEYWFAD